MINKQKGRGYGTDFSGFLSSGFICGYSDGNGRGYSDCGSGYLFGNGDSVYPYNGDGYGRYTYNIIIIEQDDD